MIILECHGRVCIVEAKGELPKKLSRETVPMRHKHVDTGQLYKKLDTSSTIRMIQMQGRGARMETW